MQKFMIMGLAAMLGLSQTAYAESQNPHDPSNQASEMDTDIHADTDVNADANVDTNTGSTGSVTPNPHSLGRTGRLRDSNDLQRNQGVQTVPSNPDNISDRIENANDANRRLHDRLDGRQSPTVDPAFNSDTNSATPVLPPGQGPGVTSDTGAASDTGTNSSATSRSDRATGASARPGSRAVSGSGSASGSGTTGGSSGGSAGAGGR